MGHRRVIETYYKDVNNLVFLLEKLVGSYRLLVGGADELNKIALAKKSDVKHALKRADDLGKIIDDIIEALDCATLDCTCYTKIKTNVIKNTLNTQYIQSEIEEDLKFNG